MQIEIPTDAQVQIIVGRARPAIEESGLPASPGAGRGGRRLLKGAVAVLLLASTFAAGDYFAKTPDRINPAYAAASGASQLGVPGDPLPPTVAAQVPPAFRRQLQERPAVIPPPGPATAAPGRNPFGLEN